MFNRTTSNFFHSLENSFLFFLLKKQYQKKSYFTFSSNYYISIFVGWGPYFDNLNSMFKTLIPLASLVQGGSSTQKILQIHSIKKSLCYFIEWVWMGFLLIDSGFLILSYKINVFRFPIYRSITCFSNEIIRTKWPDLCSNWQSCSNNLIISSERKNSR